MRRPHRRPVCKHPLAALAGSLPLAWRGPRQGGTPPAGPLTWRLPPRPSLPRVPRPSRLRPRLRLPARPLWQQQPLSWRQQAAAAGGSRRRRPQRAWAAWGRGAPQPAGAADPCSACPPSMPTQRRISCRGRGCREHAPLAVLTLTTGRHATILLPTPLLPSVPPLSHLTLCCVAELFITCVHPLLRSRLPVGATHRCCSQQPACAHEHT